MEIGALGKGKGFWDRSHAFDRGKGKSGKDGKGSRGKFGKDASKFKGKGSNSKGKGPWEWNWSTPFAGKGPPPLQSNWNSSPALFRGHCGHCWEYGHMKSQCPNISAKMDVSAAGVSSATSSSGSTARISDATTATSREIAAVRASSPDGEDWPEDDDASWCADWADFDGWAPWYDAYPPEEDYTVWNEDTPDIFYVNAISGKKAADEIDPEGFVDLMVGSGSQATAVQAAFAPENEIDESDKSTMWDIQDNEIASYGRRIVNVQFEGDANPQAQLKVDVGDVAKNVVAMGRLLRAGNNLHFQNFGHTCWMEHGDHTVKLQEDDPTGEPPL